MSITYLTLVGGASRRPATAYNVPAKSAQEVKTKFAELQTEYPDLFGEVIHVNRQPEPETIDLRTDEEIFRSKGWVR